MSWPVHRAGRMAVEMKKGGVAALGLMEVDAVSARLDMMNVEQEVTAGAQGRGRAWARNYPCGLFLTLLSAGASWAAVAHAVAAD